MEKMRRGIATYCPNCKELDYIVKWLPKKKRQCKKCYGDNLIIDVNGLQDEKNIVGSFRRRLLKMILILVIIMIGTMIPFYYIFQIWFSLQVSGIIALIIEIAVILPTSIIGLEFYGYRPYEVQICDFLKEKIEKVIVSNFVNLPYYDENLDVWAKIYMNNPEGLKIIRLKDYFPAVIPTKPCKFCNSNIFFDAKFCTICGERIKRFEF